VTKRLTSKIGNLQKKSAKNLHVASPYSRVTKTLTSKIGKPQKNPRKTYMLPHPTHTRVTRPSPPESEIRRNNPRKIFMLPTHYKNDKTPTSRIEDPQKKSSKNLHVD
jgi:hypothetical protein